MSAIKRPRGSLASFFQSKAQVTKATFEPRPCGELDCDALADDVMRKYLRILRRLGEMQCPTM